MITELLLIAAAGIIDPMDMSGHQMYPSGVLECDKYPRYPYPTSKLPRLTLPQNIYASDGRIIRAGHYLVSLSISRQELLFFEGTKELYTIKVSQTEIVEKPLKLATAEFYSSNNGDYFIFLKQGKYHAKIDVQPAFIVNENE